MRGFSGYHPCILFLYYVSILIIGLSTMHPVAVLTGMLAALSYYICISSIKTVLHNVSYYFFVWVLLACINPLVSHNGVTILFFMNDNPMTLEAVRYGMILAFLIVSAVFWYKTYNHTMSSDKHLYLFGKVSSRLALFLTLLLRFLPRMREQTKAIHQTQKAMGLYCSESYVDRMRSGIRVFSSVMTWSMENTSDSVDSMRARGYGQGKRRNFHRYYVEKKDICAFGMMVICLATLFLMYHENVWSYYYYPDTAKVLWNGKQITGYVTMLLLYLLPTIIEIKENVQWNYYESRI